MTDQLLIGDARELCRAIPDGSIDLIFTDPPYPREYLPLYGWLAEEAARVLRPGGFCLAMCGGSYLNEIFRLMDGHLTYWWKYEVYLSGWLTGAVWPRGNNKVPVTTRTKSVLAYSRGTGYPRCQTNDLYQGTGADKSYHAWGQDAASTRYYVDCFSAVGDTVLDPFAGGGTTPYICEQLGRNWIACEIDPAAAETTRARLQNVQMPLGILHDEQTEMEFIA